MSIQTADVAAAFPLQRTELLPTVAVIPAAGLGTRLRPLTTGALPKEMLPVGRHLALEHIVAEMRGAGIRHIVFVLSAAKEPLIRRHFGDSSDDGMTFDYALQPEMRGLGDAVLRAERFVEARGAFVIALGDAVFDEPTPGRLTRRLANALVSERAAIGLAVQRVPRERLARYGIVQPAPGASSQAAHLRITDIVEKPASDDAPSDLAAAARYVVDPRLFAHLRNTPPAKNGEVQLTDALRAMLREGCAGIAVPLQADETRHDLGGLDSYFRAFVAFALRDPDHGDGLRAWFRSRLDTDVEENPA